MHCFRLKWLGNVESAWTCWKTCTDCVKKTVKHSLLFHAGFRTRRNTPTDLKEARAVQTMTLTKQVYTESTVTQAAVAGQLQVRGGGR